MTPPRLIPNCLATMSRGCYLNGVRGRVFPFFPHVGPWPYVEDEYGYASVVALQGLLWLYAHGGYSSILYNIKQHVRAFWSSMSPPHLKRRRGFRFFPRCVLAGRHGDPLEGLAHRHRRELFCVLCRSRRRRCLQGRIFAGHGSVFSSPRERTGATKDLCFLRICMYSTYSPPKDKKKSREIR